MSVASDQSSGRSSQEASPSLEPILIPAPPPLVLIPDQAAPKPAMNEEQIAALFNGFTQSMTTALNSVIASAGSAHQTEYKTIPKYDGASPFDVFIRQIEGFLNIDSIAEEKDKIKKVLACMEGHVQLWLPTQDKEKKLRRTYLEAKSWMLSIFPTSTDEFDTRNALETVRQKSGESVLEYLSRKSTLFMKQGLAMDREYCRNVVKGIRDDRVRNELQMLISLPTFQVSQLKTMVVAATNKINPELLIQNSPGTSSGHSRIGGNSSHSNSYGGGNLSTPGWTPRKDQFQRRNSFSGTPTKNQTKSTGSKPGTCRKCGKPGHWAYECTSRVATFQVGQFSICPTCFENQSDPALCNSSHFLQGISSFGQMTQQPVPTVATGTDPALLSLLEKLNSRLESLKISSTNPAPQVNYVFPSNQGNPNRRMEEGQPPTENQTR